MEYALGAIVLAVIFILFILVGSMLAKEEKFSGIITLIDTGCFADGICQMTIDGKDIVFGRGWSGSTWGEVIGFDLTNGEKKYIGKKAEVFAQKLIESYTLEGNKKYYIKLLD